MCWSHHLVNVHKIKPVCTVCGSSLAMPNPCRFTSSNNITTYGMHAHYSGLFVRYIQSYLEYNVPFQHKYGYIRDIQRTD